MTKADIAKLADMLNAAKRIVVLTGAGISTESGIPDFRSPGGLWTRMEPILYDDFLASEAERLKDWQRRFDMRAQLATAKPNAGHLFLADLAEAGTLQLLITQNIDGLHQQSGVPEEKLCEIHGNGTRSECLDCGASYGLDWAEEQIGEKNRAPRCTQCHGLVKAAVVSFGQAMPMEKLAIAEQAARTCDLFLTIGTSLNVYPAAALPEVAARAGRPVIIINRDPTNYDSSADLVLNQEIGETFLAVKPFVKLG